MLTFLAWYFLVTLVGWAAFPLLYRLLPSFADRGYGLARLGGLLLWGYFFWLFGSLGLLQNDLGSLLLAFFLVLGLSLFFLWFREGDPALSPPERLRLALGELLSWAWSRWRIIATTEALFLFAFGFMALTRAANPELVGTEKPMELAFINAILRSPTFPPHDPWLSGYAISYYYFGYLLTAMLARLSGVWGSVAHNLMTALTFALAAQAAHSLVFNLLAARHRESLRLALLALLAPLFLLVLSNWEGLLEVVHRAGWLWSDAPGAFNFWRWLDIKDLNLAPAQPYGWLPDRFWWWWRASRVVQDYTWLGAEQEIIDEFPFFSFLLGDLHPHVLAIPYTLLAISLAFHLYLRPRAVRSTFPWVDWPTFAFLALTLGGTVFLNTWDVLILGLLVGLVFLRWRLRDEGWGWERLEEAFLFIFGLALLAALAYLPFLISFSSQARGILPNLLNPTRGAHLWVMFGPLFVPILVYLWAVRPAWRERAWLWGFLGSAVTFLVFFGLSWAVAALIAAAAPDLSAQFFQVQGLTSWGELFSAAWSRRRLYAAGGLTLFLLLALTFAAYLRSLFSRRSAAQSPSPNELPFQSSEFALLLIGLGVLWIILPEFFYLGDQFGWRINTIFKFYYQAWIFLSLAAAYGLVTLVLEGRLRIPAYLAVTLALLAGLVYPTLGWWSKTGGLFPLDKLTLDDFRRLESFQPAEAQAIRWLQAAPFGVVAEAVGGSYTEYGRVATYSGLPDVLNWPGHESQWRGGAEPQGTREGDIRLLYETSSWDEARLILERYRIRYVYVGNLERVAYALQLEKFDANLPAVFFNEGVVIYEFPLSP